LPTKQLTSLENHLRQFKAIVWLFNLAIKQYCIPIFRKIYFRYKPTILTSEITNFAIVDKIRKSPLDGKSGSLATPMFMFFSSLSPPLQQATQWDQPANESAMA
jgi:hypothetical protein